MDSHCVEMHTKLSLHKRVYLRIEVFDRREFPPGAMEWVWPTLEQQARASAVQPRHSQDIDYLAKGLRIAAALKSWDEIAMTSMADVKTDQAVALFTELESRLIEQLGKCHVASRISAITRALITAALQAESRDPRMFKLRKIFRTRCVTRSRGRALISDIPHPNRPPLQALPHATAADLRRATQEIIEWDLEQLTTAALAVLKRYEIAVSAIARWEQKQYDQHAEVRVRAMVKQVGLSDGVDAEWSDDDVDIYLSLELAIKRGAKPPFERARSPQRLYAKNVGDVARKKLGEMAYLGVVQTWLTFREAPPGEVLVACGLLIQMKTGWNFISVLELLPVATDVTSFPHQIQSLKPRTRDKTPPVFIEKSDDDVLLAFRILKERFDRLIALGFVEPGLWASARSVRRGTSDVLVGWGSELRRFSEKHGLPRFSFEMVRVQVLAAEAVATGSLDGARSKAGHSKPSTTYHYIDKQLLRRMNAANSFEFENRFDATVKYMIDPSSVSSDQILIKYPIGDGATCKDPNNPPVNRSKTPGVCGGERCHAKGGCPNRVIEITEERIEEVVRTRLYLEQNWNRLLNENAVAFENIHLPRLEFALALYGAIRRGPYRHLLKKYEESTAW